MAKGFWLSDDAWAAIRPLLPHNQPGARRVDDRRVISGVIHVLKSGCRWQGCPRGLWQKIFEELVGQADIPQELSIDSTAVRAHRSAHGAKGGAKIHALTDSYGRIAAFNLTCKARDLI